MTNLDPGLETLLQHARVVAQRSYSPYSDFKVGAALRLTSGEIVTGTNVENVSYGLTICAERSALVRAVSEFGPGIRIAAVAVANLTGAAACVITDSWNGIEHFLEPEHEVLVANSGQEVARVLTRLTPPAATKI